MASSLFLSARRKPSSFATEADMTAVAIQVAEAAWWRTGEQLDFVGTEVVASGAIADVVATSFDHPAVRRRAKAQIEPLTDWTAIVCASLCREQAAIAKIVDCTGLSRSGASRSLSLAVEHGVVVREGRRFQLADGWESPVTRVVAAELKLRDWQKGLAQAKRYRRWADSSWLILGATAGLDAPNHETPNGIGLLRLTPEGQVQRARLGRVRKPTNALERIWVGEQILRQALAAGWRPALRAPAARLSGAPVLATP
jgi:hypothetical protein